MERAKHELYRLRALIYAVGFILMTTAIYIEDAYFTDRWEWPTFILMPFLVAHAVMYLLPAFLVALICLKSPGLMVFQSALLFGTAAVLKYWVPEISRVFSDGPLTQPSFLVLPLYWIVTVAVVVGCIILERKVLRSEATLTTKEQ